MRIILNESIVAVFALGVSMVKARILNGRLLAIRGVMPLNLRLDNILLGEFVHPRIHADRRKSIWAAFLDITVHESSTLALGNNLWGLELSVLLNHHGSSV